jgi:hypothetical protein
VPGDDKSSYEREMNGVLILGRTFGAETVSVLAVGIGFLGVLAVEDGCWGGEHERVESFRIDIELDFKALNLI